MPKATESLPVSADPMFPPLSIYLPYSIFQGPLEDLWPILHPGDVRLLTLEFLFPQLESPVFSLNKSKRVWVWGGVQAELEQRLCYCKQHVHPLLLSSFPKEGSAKKDTWEAGPEQCWLHLMGWPQTSQAEAGQPSGPVPPVSRR